MQSPFFRGATKPAMLLGVPTNELIMYEFPLIILVATLWPLISYRALLIFIPMFVLWFVMYEVTKKDEHYLKMAVFESREFFWLWNNRNRLWNRSPKISGKISAVPPQPLRELGI